MKEISSKSEWTSFLENKVRTRAYEIWENTGWPEEKCWISAKKEVIAGLFHYYEVFDKEPETKELKT